MAAVVANVTCNTPFRILVANFGSTLVQLRHKQAIAKAAPPPSNVAEAHISHSEMFELIPDGKFRKHHIYPENIDTINKHLVDQREIDMAEDEKKTTADKIKHDVLPDNEQAVRDMIRKHVQVLSGQLSQIKETKLRINSKSNAKPFKCPPYRADPKTRELEQSESNKKLTGGFIEPPISEWVAPVLLVHKKDGCRRFCIT